ncbi:MAG: PepSY-associated TM helix domain-containing protein [Pseudomonadota bacterium]|nr:PepSY-associated TM helix domain-containing protein [Pseudomonadota bacterium]
MGRRISPATVRRSLSAHSGIGLVVGALMYLICLTGTLVVFFEEFERWEQPQVTENTDYSGSQIDAAIANFLKQSASLPETVYVVLPSVAMPRLHLSAGDEEWFVDADGTLGIRSEARWTRMLQSLHIQLHLPTVPGVIFVGALGVFLCSLIFSGLLAHPTIVRDAFRLRTGGAGRLAKVDLHNRLSVWGLPFHLMIALTGAFLGLVSLFYAGVAETFHDGDREQVFAQMYGSDPVVFVQEAVSPDVDSALRSLALVDPKAEPMYVALMHPGTRRQYVEIAARVPRRLIYSEIYRFTSAGEYMNRQALSDGPRGRQVAYSVYRLHFGNFAGLWVKLLYGLMGLALTAICVTGVNIWLAKRAYRSAVNDLWAGFVWGAPLALSVAASGALLGVTPLPVFALGLFTACLLGVILQDERKTARWLVWALAGGLAAVAVIHLARFGIQTQTGATGWVNGTLIAVALVAAVLGAGLRGR